MPRVTPRASVWPEQPPNNIMRGVPIRHFETSLPRVSQDKVANALSIIGRNYNMDVEEISRYVIACVQFGAARTPGFIKGRNLLGRLYQYCPSLGNAQLQQLSFCISQRRNAWFNENPNASIGSSQEFGSWPWRDIITSMLFYDVNDWISRNVGWSIMYDETIAEQRIGDERLRRQLLDYPMPYGIGTLADQPTEDGPTRPRIFSDIVT